ncbi:MAG: hypothetical protein OQL19_10725 [Gammaproteobacteria bacterium]|nr:hypothetical protein [Gammaproteobacteria bacterium]
MGRLVHTNGAFRDMDVEDERAMDGLEHPNLYEPVYPMLVSL